MGGGLPRPLQSDGPSPADCGPQFSSHFSSLSLFYVKRRRFRLRFSFVSGELFLLRNFLDTLYFQNPNSLVKESSQIHGILKAVQKTQEISTAADKRSRITANRRFTAARRLCRPTSIPGTGSLSGGVYHISFLSTFFIFITPLSFSTERAPGRLAGRPFRFEPAEQAPSPAFRRFSARGYR